MARAEKPTFRKPGHPGHQHFQEEEQEEEGEEEPYFAEEQEDPADEVQFFLADSSRHAAILFLCQLMNEQDTSSTLARLQ